MRNIVNYNEDDYKYIGVINVDILKEIFDNISFDNMVGYSLMVLYKSNTYVISVYQNTDNEIIYSVMNYKYKKRKKPGKEFNDYHEFLRCIKDIFNDDEILVLLDIEYNNEVVSYPVTMNEYLNKNIITRTDPLYKNNMPNIYSIKNFDNFFTFIVVFLLTNIFISFVCIINRVTNHDTYLAIVAIIYSIISIIFLLLRYGYKTRFVNGLIESTRLFKLKRTYNYSEIKSVDDVVLFNVFNTKKIYRLHMMDGTTVKIKYFSTSNMEDDELKEIIVYFREMLINNNIKINHIEISNRLVMLIMIILYIILMIFI